MKRRTVITAGGSAVMAAVAGCLADDDGPIEEDAADLLLSADEISETAPGDWQKENLGIVEGVEAAGISGVESAEGVELAGK